MKLRRKRLVVATGGVVAAVAVLALAVMAGQHYMDPDRISSPPSDERSPSAETTEPEPNSRDGSASSNEPAAGQRRDLVDFESSDGGFAISYPKEWERIETPPDSAVKLVATPDDQNSLKVSTTDLGFSVGSDELPAVRQYTTSRIEDSREDVDVVAGPSRVELDDLPGYVYIYTFADPDTGETGVHSHYFLFDGDTMFTLVFQALPEERYEELAPLFDTIADSFRRQ